MNSTLKKLGTLALVCAIAVLCLDNISQRKRRAEAGAPRWKAQRIELIIQTGTNDPDAYSRAYSADGLHLTKNR